MKLERGLTFGHDGIHSQPFFYTEQKTQLDLINQTNSLQPTLANMRVTAAQNGKLMDSNISSSRKHNRLSQENPLSHSLAKAKEQRDSSFQGRQDTLMMHSKFCLNSIPKAGQAVHVNNFMNRSQITQSPIIGSETNHALSGAGPVVHTSNVGLFSGMNAKPTLNTMPDMPELQSNLSLSYLKHYHHKNKPCNENQSEQQLELLMYDTEVLKHQNSDLEKENALLRQKVEQQQEEIEALKEKERANKLE